MAWTHGPLKKNRLSLKFFLVRPWRERGPKKQEQKRHKKGHRMVTSLYKAKRKVRQDQEERQERQMEANEKSKEEILQKTGADVLKLQLH